MSYTPVICQLYGFQFRSDPGNIGIILFIPCFVDNSIYGHNLTHVFNSSCTGVIHQLCPLVGHRTHTPKCLGISNPRGGGCEKLAVLSGQLCLAKS